MRNVPPASTTGGIVVGSTPGLPVLIQPTEFQNAFAAVPKGVQDRIIDLLLVSDNYVCIDLNASVGKAVVVTKSGYKTSTLNASWNPHAHLPVAPTSAATFTGPTHSAPHLTVRADESVKPEDRANPNTGLRHLY